MRRVLQLLVVTVLAACGNDGGDVGERTATISIEIAGLPAGTKGDILVTGPQSFRRELGVASTFSGLPPGDYTVKATNVLDGSAVFAPQQASRTFTLAGGANQTAVVTYGTAGTLQLGLQQVVTGVDQPLFLTAPAGDSRLFIIERPGRIRLFTNGALDATPVLDIASRVSTAGEGGLLSMAFDPQFASNGFLYAHYTDTTGDVVVERYRMSGDVADPASALRIITVQHRTFSNHKGGRVAFGPDGHLYLSVGDGGGGGDPFGAGQDLNTLLGKLLRMDVSNASQAAPTPQIWAYGLRNPWRFAFDASSQAVYIADVGQGAREEVNAAALAAAGLNYGWNLMEGLACFSVNPCNQPGLTLPVLDYDRSSGCSVIGGFVYRGSAIPELRGRYLYSDLCGGWLRSFRYNGNAAVEQVDWNIASVGSIYSFGEDAQGELYMLATSNVIYKIVRQ
jgi:glucose/arabinose dehydrogenase